MHGKVSSGKDVGGSDVDGSDKEINDVEFDGVVVVADRSCGEVFRDGIVVGARLCAVDGGVVDDDVAVVDGDGSSYVDSGGDGTGLFGMVVLILVVAVVCFDGDTGGSDVC